MHFEEGEAYHIYNRGNDKQRIFFNSENYLFFLKKVKGEWCPFCDILCYCLMPNHFHLMVIPNTEGCKELTIGGKSSYLQNLSKTIGKTLSSYTKAINIQNQSTGNLFQKKTKAKWIGESSNSMQFVNITDYLITCFFYIHQNPLKAHLVKDLKEWPFSSWPDYAGINTNTLCNKVKLFELTGLTERDCLSGTHPLKKEIVDQIF